ncbi:RNA-binding family protein isoform 1 [Hibiscus syriacus]|uniref:RNA-binding family protein isoform 1 n=1 Tax=Hibiscus syriacus TaxID=106335 RepID=A0A6A3B3R6_HIBSY|nr:RNA-binding family protein isoform 1 [Hibiscus syriacus]
MPNATGTNVLFLWSAISNFMPILGAFISHSFLARFHVIAMGTVISLIHVMVNCSPSASKASALPQSLIEPCASPKAAQLALLFSFFALMSIGAGGIRPCSLAFGADQFYNPSDPNNNRVLQSFFNWYYASVGLAIMIAITIIVYIQDKAGWIIGFRVPAGLMFLSTVMFLNQACMIRSSEDIGMDGRADHNRCNPKQHTFPVLQATSMDRHLVPGGFEIPAGSFGLFAMISLTIWLAAYDQIIVPLLSKFTKRSRGFSLKERMGIGLVVSCVATAAAAMVEHKRRTTAIRQGLANSP